MLVRECAQDVIREWRRASREEVDFLLEAKNALQALNALRRHNVDVTCPEPIQSCCSQRVLTMVFIEGWKITDLDRMPYGADRETLARDLVHAFALLVFQEGLIHGDPHPGISTALCSTAASFQCRTLVSRFKLCARQCIRGACSRQL